MPKKTIKFDEKAQRFYVENRFATAQVRHEKFDSEDSTHSSVNFAVFNTYKHPKEINFAADFASAVKKIENSIETLKEGSTIENLKEDSVDQLSD